jgi:hypothetical protein
VGKTNPDQHGTVREVFSDITLAMGTETLLIDVAVVSPGGSAYLQYPISINQDGASKHKEQSKRWHYGKIAAPHTPAPNSVIPFVLESSGRLGPTAHGFLFRILPTQTFLRTSFLNDVALCGAGRVGGWDGGRRTKGKSRKAWFAGVAVA